MAGTGTGGTDPAGASSAGAGADGPGADRTGADGTGADGPGAAADATGAGGAGAVLRLRTPRTTLLAVFVLAICVMPLAASTPWLAVLWLLPVAVGAWVLRAGVDVDRAGLTVRALLGSRRLPWAEVAGLRITGSGRIAAVLRAGGAVRLPVVRPRHLALVSAASGGRLPAPTAPGIPESP